MRKKWEKINLPKTGGGVGPKRPGYPNKYIIGIV